MLRSLIQELRRRRTFRTAGLYIVSAWLVMQAADLFFPAWGLPDSALNILLLTAVLGFPVALIFGWYFDITEHGIVRTPPATAEEQDAPLALRGKDYALLAALGVIVLVIGFGGLRDLLTTRDTEPDLAVAESADNSNSIAVLPFVNSTTDPDFETFCDGISEEILHKLASVDGLRVMGRASSFAFKDSDFSTSRIAGALGVQYLLQGSVRRDGDRIRVIATLVDKDGVQHKSQPFNRELGDIFAIQAEIAQVVTAVVAPTLTYADSDSYRPDPYVYQTFLAGRELLRKRDNQAGEVLAKAVELDPNYADAHAELAIATMIGGTLYRDFDDARHSLDAAMALNPLLPRRLPRAVSG